MRASILCVLAFGLGLAGCGGGQINTGDENAVALAVEPSLRAAAANAEANQDYKGAAQHWRTLYQRHPEDRIIAVQLARMTRYAGQPQQAADLMQSHLARRPDDGELLAELGKDYLAADRTGLGLRTLEQARAVAPSRWDVHSALGVAYDMEGRKAEAEAAYAKALELSPGNPQVLNNLGLNQALQGRLFRPMES